MTAAEHARGFARLLLGDRSALARQYATLWTWPARRTRYLSASDADGIASAAVELDTTPGTAAVYIGVGVTDVAGMQDQRPKGRRQQPDDVEVSGLLAVAVDVDIAGPGHTEKHRYPATEADARRVIEAMRLPPTLVVASGGGLQPWWVFTEPLIFGQVDTDDEDRAVLDPYRIEQDRADAAELLWSWVTTVRIQARALGGWYVDPTGDLARVLRMPGTTNRKVDGGHRPVRLLDRGGATYNPSDLTPYLADPVTLDTYRMAGAEASGELEGVDVHAVWARAHSALYRSRGFVPPWLADIIQLDADLGGRIGATFHGRRTDLGGDDSTIDASLARQLADVDADPEQICEAIICRRLKYAGKTAKVDPSRRTDYLARTVGRFIATSRARREQVVAREAGARDSIAAAAVVAERVLRPAAELDDAGRAAAGVRPVDVDEAPADEVADEVADEPEPTDPPETVDPEDPPVVPDDRDHEALARVTAMLSMPDGYTVSRVEYRRGLKLDEVRLWVHRGPDASSPPGRTWPAGTLAATRWRRKSAWEKPGEVTTHLLHDLHLVCGVPQKNWRTEGLPLLYRLFRETHVGTPHHGVRAAFRDLLLRQVPVASFGEARDNGWCWLVANPPEGTPVVAVPAAGLRRHMQQMGEMSPMSVEDLVTVAAGLGAEVRLGVQVSEHFRVVRDSRTWLVVPPGLLTEGDWRAVRQSIEDHATNHPSNVRPIRGAG